MRFLRLPITCDGCKNPINQYRDAMVEWVDDGQIKHVHIVHHPSASPNGDCHLLNRQHRQDNHLEAIMTDRNLLEKLELIL